MESKNSFKSVVLRDKFFNKTWKQATKVESSDSESDTKSEGDIPVNKNINSTGYILDKLEKVDEDITNNLSCYHYPKKNESLEPIDDSFKDYKGIVNEGDKIICKTFSYCPEYPITNIDKLKEILCEKDNLKEGSRYFQSIEGCMLTLFFYKNKWHLKTNRKLDAFQSKWGCDTSFGEIFMMSLVSMIDRGLVDCGRAIKYENKDDVFDLYTSFLDTSKIYCYIVKNIKENRLVCKVGEPEMFFIGEFQKDKLLKTNSSFIKYPFELYPKDFNDLLEQTKLISHENGQGVIVYMKDDTQIKIMNEKYMEYFNIRNNCFDIYKRYFELRMDEEKVSKLYELYPEYIEVFQYYEKLIVDVAKNIYDAYTNRYIKKVYATLPQDEYIVMNNLFSKFRYSLTINNILDELDNQESESLYYMIDKYSD